MLRVSSFPLLLLITILTKGSSFVPHLGSRSLHAPTPLCADSNGEMEEAIERLLNRRQIMKNITNVEPVYDEKVGEKDLDLTQLPEFRTNRNVDDLLATPETPNEQESIESDNSPVVDYMADYRDENDLHIPNRIVATTCDWGDPSREFVSSGKLSRKAVKRGAFVPGDAQLSHAELLKNGIMTIETSPTYGAASTSQGLSAQQLLAKALEKHGKSLPKGNVIVTNHKNPWINMLQQRASSLGAAQANVLESTLKVLDGVSMVDVYQARKSPVVPSALWAAGMAAVLEGGDCDGIGVVGLSNARSLTRLNRILQKNHKVGLTTCSFDFSIINTKSEALLKQCKKEGVIPLCTDTLSGGLASGKFTALNPTGGKDKAPFSFKKLEAWQPLHGAQETVAERINARLRRDKSNQSKGLPAPPVLKTGVTTSQVAWQYVIAKGGVPVIPVNSPKMAEEVMGCLGWTLTKKEIETLEESVKLCKVK